MICLNGIYFDKILIAKVESREYRTNKIIDSGAPKLGIRPIYEYKKLWDVVINNEIIPLCLETKEEAQTYLDKWVSQLETDSSKEVL